MKYLKVIGKSFYNNVFNRTTTKENLPLVLNMWNIYGFGEDAVGFTEFSRGL